MWVLFAYWFGVWVGSGTNYLPILTKLDLLF